MIALLGVAVLPATSLAQTDMDPEGFVGTPGQGWGGALSRTAASLTFGSMALGGDIAFLATDLHYGARGLPTGWAILEIVWGALHASSMVGIDWALQGTEPAAELVYFGSFAAIGVAEIVHGIWSLTQTSSGASPTLEQGPSLSFGVAPTEGGGMFSLSGRM